MLAERLAVVGDHHHRRVRKHIEPLQALEETTRRRIGVGHLAVVRRPGMRCGERCRRRVR